VLGRAQVGGHSVALPVADARHHIHLVGKTGTGKSTLLLNMILDDVRAGRGAVVIDPRGDLVTDLLDRLPASVAGTPAGSPSSTPTRTTPPRSTRSTARTRTWPQTTWSASSPGSSNATGDPASTTPSAWRA
jgi:hypothetical protein